MKDVGIREARNAAKGIKAPRPKKKIAPLTPDRARAFVEAARGDRFEALFVLALHCGLREDELLGLRWDDVDLEAGTLRVRRTLSETRDGPIFEPPKNGKGRNVSLTGAAVDALRDHLARQMREIDEGYEDNGLVFASQTGNTMSASNLVGRHFKPLLKRAKLLRVRPHDLRHTCATLLLIKGVHPKYVQELLGHANISITLDTYSHVIPRAWAIRPWTRWRRSLHEPRGWRTQSLPQSGQRMASPTLSEQRISDRYGHRRTPSEVHIWHNMNAVGWACDSD